MADLNSTCSPQDVNLPATRAYARLCGSVRYFTGKPCKHGHLSERQTSNGCCLRCVDIRSAMPENEKKRKEARKRTYEKHKGKKLAYGKRYREKNSEKFKEWQRNWREKNRERYREIQRAAQARRRAGMKGASREALEEWISLQDKICYWCGKKCAKDFHVDHYIPLAKGGAHEADNLVIACPTCNVRKSAKDPYEFANNLGRLF